MNAVSRRTGAGVADDGCVFRTHRPDQPETVWVEHVARHHFQEAFFGCMTWWEDSMNH